MVREICGKSSRQNMMVINLEQFVYRVDYNEAKISKIKNIVTLLSKMSTFFALFLFFQVG